MCPQVHSAAFSFCFFFLSCQTPSLLLADVGDTYEVVLLDVDELYVTGQAIDDRGRIAAQITDEENYWYWRWGGMWENAAIVASRRNSEAELVFTGVSPSGGIMIGYSDYDSRCHDPFIWPEWGNFSNFNICHIYGDTYARAINSDFWVVGNTYDGTHAFLWNNGTLLPLRGEPAFAFDVNRDRVVVGSARLEGSGDPVPVVWPSPDSPYMVGDGVPGSLVGINDRMDLVGTRNTLSPLPFAVIQGRIVDLPMLSSRFEYATPHDISEDRIVIGEQWYWNTCCWADCDGECWAPYPVIWEPLPGEPYQYAAIDINTRVRGMPQGRRLDFLSDVNTAGQMGASDINIEFGNVVGSYLLNPFQFSLTAPDPGLAGQVNHVTVTGLEPGERVVLVIGSVGDVGLGAGAQPTRPDCPGATLLLREVRYVSPGVRADAAGVAVVSAMIPSWAAGLQYRMQAVSSDSCNVSHTVNFALE